MGTEDSFTGSSFPTLNHLYLSIYSSTPDISHSNVTLSSTWTSELLIVSIGVPLGLSEIQRCMLIFIHIKLCWLNCSGLIAHINKLMTHAYSHITFSIAVSLSVHPTVLHTLHLYSPLSCLFTIWMANTVFRPDCTSELFLYHMKLSPVMGW